MAATDHGRAFTGPLKRYWGRKRFCEIVVFPQSLHRDFGMLIHLWKNIAHCAARTRKGGGTRRLSHGRHAAPDPS